MKAVISAILFTIQYELNLGYTILESRDKDEIFCQITAREDWLERKAQAEEYRLQFKADRNDIGNVSVFPFKEVAPYAKFEIPEDDQKNPERVKQLFTHYDASDVPSETGSSMFMYTDKIRLVRNSLNTRLSMHIMKEHEISIEDFCLHTKEPLDELKKEWATLAKIFAAQPLDKIRNYFGEKTALYFGWMETYKNFMISTAILGAAVQVIVFVGEDNEDSTDISLTSVVQVLYAMYLAWWASTFDQVWTRKEKILAWRWGTTSFYEEEEQRGEFKGKMHQDPVSNKMKRNRTNELWHRLRIFLSYSIVLVFVVSVAGIIASILFLRYMLVSEEKLTWLGLCTAGALNALQIRGMDILYGKVAVLLNDWENHETETEYNNKLAVKVFMFKFVNAYASLFYLAYFADLGINCTEDCLTNMQALEVQLAIIFLLSLLMNVIEIVLPWALMKRRIIAENMHMTKLKETNPHLRDNLYPVEKEAKCESFESPLDDYIEMIIELGYVVMFSTALPVLSLFLLLEIMVEVRVDAWKICNNLKRADPHRSEDIGVFKDIVVFIAYVGAINNAGIIVFPSGLFDAALSGYGDSQNDRETMQVLIFIALEHLLILGMFMISVIIPDEPEVVQKGLVWSERVINEKLYKIPPNKSRDALGKATEEDAANFEVSESKISYTE